MKRTLLDIVQDILSDFNSDEVNSIGDTAESLQIARIVRQSYWDILIDRKARELEAPFEVEAIGGPLKPVLVSKPANVSTINWLKYDRREPDDVYPDYQTLRFLPLDHFMETMYNLPKESKSNIASFTHTVNGSVLEIYYENDKAPEFYTTLDDTQILVDSFNSLIEANIQKSKTIGFGKTLPEFRLEDNFIPAIDANLFPLLLQEAKSQASIDVKQMENIVAAKRARRYKINNLHDNGDVGNKGYNQPGDKLPHYGRRRY